MTFTKDDLAEAKRRCAGLPEGHAVARDLSDKITEWCVDHTADEVAYCHGEKAEAYASFFAGALTDLPRALAALEEAWAEKDKLLELVADLVAQGCTTRREGDKSVVHHSFISVYEEAFDILENAGLLKDIGREEYQWRSRAVEEEQQ